VPADRIPYAPYSEIPGLGIIFRHVPGAWLAFLMLVMGAMGSTAALSVDFSDGLDGLAGGLVFTTVLAFAAVVLGIIGPENPAGIVMEVLALLCAAALAGFLPWNWPSDWNARLGGKRSARIYMGDSGALGLGGILAIIALFSHQETLLLLAGAMFVMEGLSVVVSAKFLASFLFRRYLRVLRFLDNTSFVPHTEFPLPFLSTPLHHHFDLLGLNRKKLVYGAWLLGAVFAILGIFVGNSPFVWERYLWRIVGIILFFLVWSIGPWTRLYFIGLHPAEQKEHRTLALYYGFPYRIFTMRLYRHVETIEAQEDTLQSYIERGTLWQRMNIFDARAMLGIFCYRAGFYTAALAQWHRIPVSNRSLRKDIIPLVHELEARLPLESKPTQPLPLNEILQQVAEANAYPGSEPTPFTAVDHETLQEVIEEDLENPLQMPDVQAYDIVTNMAQE
jgi:UDP-N-acetylmuramyl pentapeptide phosphotransferase/UDP-N-acetylglucosamine-1-phosphate transferase